MKPTIVLAAVLCLGAEASAQDYVNDELHFAISLPSAEGWTSPEIKSATSGLTVPQRLLLVARKNSGERISVQIVDVGESVSLEDPDYRQGFRDGNIRAFPPSVGVISENMTTFAGVPGYEMVIGGTIQTLPISIRMVSVVANRLQYNITGYASNRTRLTSGDVGKVLASFRFTEPPVVPVSRRGPPGAGEMLSRIAIYLVLGIIVALLARQVLIRRRLR
jgi:hypothetical protein